MEKVENNNKVILLVVFIMLLFAAVAIYNYRTDNKEEDIVDNSKEYVLLNDYSRFFTINSCVYKYIQYLQKEDFDSLFEVLDEDYVNNNGVNKNNVYSFLPNISDGTYSYVSKKIYYNRVSDNYITYYVYGYIVKEMLDSVGEKQYYSYEVNLDTNNQIFSISPYNGDLFKEELNG